MKRLISMVLSVIMVISLLPINILTVTASTFEGGDGSPQNPYQISTAEQLDAVRNDLDASYILINDIDLSKYKNWISIGGGNDDAYAGGEVDEPFNGKFDGRNFSIYGVNIKETSSVNKGGYWGLFSNLGKHCIVSNLSVHVDIHIDKIKIDYTQNWGSGYPFYVGGIAGYANEDAEVLNCRVYGNINVVNCNDAKVGGILGQGKVSKSINYADIYVLSNKDSRNANDGTVYVGGIVGHSGTINSLIDRNLNYGSIDATSGHFLYCGGISGEYGYIQYCVNYGDVSGETVYTGAYSSFAGNSNVGGIVGATSSSNTSFSANMGNINAIGTNSFAGGIVGFCGYYSNGRISNCYNNSSNIKSLNIKKTKIKNEYVYEKVDGNSGRIAGRISGAPIEEKISSCYSISTTKTNDYIPQDKTTSNDINGETRDKTYIEKQVNTILQNILGILLEGEMSIKNGNETILKATRYDENGNVAPEGGITWSCSDESIVKITPSGNSVTVKGLKSGKATITATHAESGQKADFEIEVVSYIMTMQGGYTVMLDEELEINYAVKQGEEYVHNDLDIKWEIESKDSNNAVKIISDKDNAYTRALTIKGINEGECELVAKVDGAEIGRTKIEVDAEIRVFVDDEEVKFDQPPIMKNDRVLVPIRKIAEKMGDTVRWNEELNSALIIHPDRMVIFQNNSNTVRITKNGDINNWSSYNLDVPAQIINGRTLTPVRAIGECLGGKVKWDEKKYAVYIETDKNVKQTVTANDISNLNAYYSTKLKKTNLSKYSTDINSFFDSRTNTWGDAFLMFWDDWWLGIKNAASGETNDVYMMKNAFASVLAEMPDNGDLKANIMNEIKAWTDSIYNVTDSAADAFSLLEYVNFNTLSNGKLSVGTASALTKFGQAASDAGLIIQVSKVGIDTYLTLFSDYTVGLTYINNIRTAIQNSGITDEAIYEALDELENDYSNKAIKALSDASENGTVILGKTILSYVAAPFNIAEFAKNMSNLVTGVSNDAEAVKMFYSLYCFNYAIDEAYDNARNSVFSTPEKLNTYIQLFILQKSLKTKIYQSMDQLRNKKDSYTKERIDTALKELEKTNLITFE